MSRLPASVLLLSLAACGTSRGNDFAVDAQAAADNAVEDVAPVTDDGTTVVDVPAIVDAPMAVDVPAPIDMPTPIDVPAPMDMPVTTDVPRTPDVTLSPDVRPPVDVPATDAGVAVDTGGGVHCATGFADCNGLASDGCETGTQSDRGNCGGCGVVCPATQSCMGGACGCLFGGTICSGRCANLANDLSNCGACGVTCATTCTAGVCAGSSLTCDDVHYDVDGSAADGCEASDDTYAGHTQATATALAAQGCNDTTMTTISGGRIVSDARAHSPTPAGFSGTVGAAPDWYRVRAVGGTFCADNYGLTVTTTGGSSAATCYSVTFVTDTTTRTVVVSGSGTASGSDPGFGLYTENTDVYFRVEKTCSLPTQENVSYSVTFHL